jgi:hypothetical protein
LAVHAPAGKTLAGGVGDREGLGRVVVAQSTDRPPDRRAVPERDPWRVFLVATALGWLVASHGGVRTVAELVAQVSLVAWAGDEVIRGENPFRRILGAGVLARLIVLYLR